LVVSTSAIDCLERLVSKMTGYVLSGTLNPTHSLTTTTTSTTTVFVAVALVQLYLLVVLVTVC